MKKLAEFVKEFVGAAGAIVRDRWPTAIGLLIFVAILLGTVGLLYVSGEKNYAGSVSAAEYNEYLRVASQNEYEFCRWIGYDLPIWLADKSDNPGAPGQVLPRSFACARKVGEDILFAAAPPCNTLNTYRSAKAPSRQWLRQVCGLHIPERRAWEDEKK